MEHGKRRGRDWALDVYSERGRRARSHVLKMKRPCRLVGAAVEAPAKETQETSTCPRRQIVSENTYVNIYVNSVLGLVLEAYHRFQGHLRSLFPRALFTLQSAPPFPHQLFTASLQTPEVGEFSP